MATRTTPAEVQTALNTRCLAQDIQNFLVYQDRASSITAASAAATYYTKAQSAAAVAVVATSATAATAAAATNQSGISAVNANIASILSGGTALAALNVFDESYTARVAPTNVVSLKCKSDAINSAALLINHEVLTS